MDNDLEPLVGRDRELVGTIEILCHRTRNSPVLVGESGVGKTAIVEGLAQRIADGEVPSFLADKRIFALDLSLIVAGTKYRGQFEERLKFIMKELMESQNSILFIDEMQTLVGAGSQEGSQDAANILKPALSRGEIQCIGATTPVEYRRLIERDHSLERLFQDVKVPPASESDAIKILFGIKDRYEKFHCVSYTDEAINYSVAYANRYLPDRYLPGKAINVLDAAGTRVMLRRTSLPDEVTEVQKRIKFIVHRMENAIANHELEKARFYDDEERKERESLRALREKYHLDESSAGVVGREDIEDVISSWTGLSIDSLRAEGPSSSAPLESVECEAEAPARSGVFVSYSRKDKKWLDSLMEHLAPLRQRGMDVWTDQQIEPGNLWNQEIEKRLAMTRVAILLVTPSYLSSQYVVSHELPALLIAAEQKGLLIFWIPVIASSYTETEIAQFQAAHAPSKPLNTLSGAKRAEALVNIAAKLSKSLASLKAKPV